MNLSRNKILPAVFAAAMLFSGCSESSSDKGSDSTSAGTSAVTQPAATGAPETASAEPSATLPAASAEPEQAEPSVDGKEQIDPFEGLEVQFDGVAPYLNVSFNNSKCPSVVQNNVTFTCADTNFTNGDSITVKAEYNAADFEGLNVEIGVDTKEYEVSDMPEYVTDFSKIDTTALDNEIEDYMNAHYLDSSGGFGSVYSIMGADVYDGSGFDKECRGSEVENTYYLVLKPNILDPDKVNNYYFKVYNNTYFLTGGDIGDHEINVYSCIYIKNIIAYPDGTLKYDPKVEHNADKSKEIAYYNGISSKNDEYNITELK
ncbi:MAG: hypothetical protein IJ737_05690 [Ruminococcus sp.]|nr:hypothetical protein [Ruminococcus sp.]